MYYICHLWCWIRRSDTQYKPIFLADRIGGLADTIGLTPQALTSV